MILYDKLWIYMAQVNPQTGKRRKLNDLYDDPAKPDRHPPTGLTQGTINRLRAGYAASLETIDKLCAALECQPGDILTWVPGEQPAYIRPEDRDE